MNPDASQKTRIGQIYQSSMKILFKRRESGLLFVLLLVGLILSLSTTTFCTAENLFNVLKQVSLVAIVAAGQTFIIISGGIDLSVGFILGISGIIMAYLMNAGITPLLAIPSALITGVLFGYLNGIFITRLKLPPFIVTLGMASITRGLVLVITKAFMIPIDNSFVLALGQGYLGVVPLMAIAMLIIIVVVAFLLDQTVFGNRVKAIGGNELAAKLSGIKVDKMKRYVYALSGLLCGISGIIMAGRLNAGNPNAGLNFDMDSIAAVIVGGTSLTGGSGSIIGSFLGALLLGAVRNGLVLLDVNMYWQTVATGVIIIAVCALDRMTVKKEN
ncbi:MAG TPA: ribose ABC transporter permease [Firmicutes bacterium]|nr:ribose ABC transporter permease [Bacillota bacterium]